jgi:hypothetical protein
MEYGTTYRDDPKRGHREDNTFKPAGGKAHELLCKSLKPLVKTSAATSIKPLSKTVIISG